MDWTPEDDLTDDTRLRGLGLSRLEEERVVFRLDLDCRTCRSRRARGVIAPVLPIAVRRRVLLALHAATIAAASRGKARNGALRLAPSQGRGPHGAPRRRACRRSLRSALASLLSRISSALFHCHHGDGHRPSMCRTKGRQFPSVFHSPVMQEVMLGLAYCNCWVYRNTIGTSSVSIA
jgi:hypothetical protein